MSKLAHGGLHEECANEISRLEAKLAAMTQERDAASKGIDKHLELATEQALLNKALVEKLVASQAREAQLREALTELRRDITHMSKGRYLNLQDVLLELIVAIDLPTDDTALRQWGAKLLREIAAYSQHEHREIESAKMLARKADELEAGK